MIEGYIGGRLGNQLLEYAMIRMLRWMRGDKEPIKLNFQPVYRGGRPEDGWEDSLRHFKVLPYKVSDCNLFLSDGALSQITGYCTDKLQRFLCHAVTYKQVGIILKDLASILIQIRFLKRNAWQDTRMYSSWVFARTPRVSNQLRTYSVTRFSPSSLWAKRLELF